VLALVGKAPCLQKGHKLVPQDDFTVVAAFFQTLRRGDVLPAKGHEHLQGGDLGDVFF